MEIQFAHSYVLSSIKGFWMFGKKPISLNGKWQVVKNDMYSMQNYRLVSLLPISGEIMTRFLYDSMFSFFIENNLISQNQSGFKPGDSYSNQLLFLTHDTYQSFDDDWKVSEVFLNNEQLSFQSISKSCLKRPNV